MQKFNYNDKYRKEIEVHCRNQTEIIRKEDSRTWEIMDIFKYVADMQLQFGVMVEESQCVRQQLEQL